MKQYTKPTVINCSAWALWRQSLRHS